MPMRRLVPGFEAPVLLAGGQRFARVRARLAPSR